jgi:hypothetical protein
MRKQETGKAAGGKQEPIDVNVEDALADEEMEDRSMYSDAAELFGSTTPLESRRPSEAWRKVPESVSALPLRTPPPSDSVNGDHSGALDAKMPAAKPNAAAPPKTMPRPLLLNPPSPPFIPRPRLLADC